MKSKKNKLKSLLRQREYEQQQSFKEQKKEAKKLIIQNAYNDPLKHEIISRSSTSDVLAEMAKKFESVINGAIPEVEKGLVLINDYGHGFYQSFGGVN